MNGKVCALHLSPHSVGYRQPGCRTEILSVRFVFMLERINSVLVRVWTAKITVQTSIYAARTGFSCYFYKQRLELV